MTYEKLLEDRIIEPVKVPQDEIAYLLGVARRDIKLAENLKSSSLDWAFAIAYNSILQLSIAYMNFLGYRPRSGAKHVNTFKFMEKAVSEEEKPMVRRMQQLRRKRNLTIYERAGLVTEKEAREIVEFAVRYYKDIESKLPKELVELSNKLEKE